VGFESSATDKIRAKATSSESTERRQNQILEESEVEGRSDVSSDGTRNNALTSSQGRKRQIDSHEDEARWRRSSHERIRPDNYHSPSVIAQRNGRVTNRRRTVSCIRESQPSASNVGPHASSWRGVTDSSETVLDHIGEPASSWHVASPSPDRTRSLHAFSWRGAPTVSGVRTGDLELFFRRFQTLAEYFDWRGEEKLFRLKNCIRDDAQYVLMDLGGLLDVDQFIQALKSRFGTTTHAERYRTELGQLRRGTLSLEQLHLKV